MRVKISEIPHEGLDVEFDQKLESMDCRAKVKATLNRVGPDVLVRGTVSARLTLQCGRCLETFTEDVDVPFELYFGSEQDLEEGEHELEIEEVSRALIGDDVIDLGQMAGEQIILNVPMKPLCCDDCKGLCSKCGAVLNKGDCGCDRSTVDPRLQELKKFLKKGEENNA